VLPNFNQPAPWHGYQARDFPPKSKQVWCTEMKKDAYAPAAVGAPAAAAVSFQENPFDILE
jgi:hypothetical protein